MKKISGKLWACLFALSMVLVAINAGAQALPTGLKNHAVAVLLIDPDTGKIVDANGSATRLYGRTGQELLEMKIQDLNALDPERVAQEMRKTQSGQSSHFIFPHRTRGNEIRAVEVYSSAYSGKDQKKYLLSIVLDAENRSLAPDEVRAYKDNLENLAESRAKALNEQSQRQLIIVSLGLFLLVLAIIVMVLALRNGKRTMTALQTERARLAVMFSHSRDGIHILDEQGNLVICSDSFAQGLGYEATEMVGMNVAQWDAWIKPEKVSTLMRRLFAQGRVAESVHRCKDGRLIEVEISSQSFELAGVRYLFASSRDITSRKRVEQALVGSEERLQLALKGMNDGVWDWDVRSGTLYLSPRFKELFGYADHEMPNDFGHFEACVHPEDQQMIREGFVAYLRDQTRRFRVEFRCKHKSGQWRWMLLRGEGLRDPSGQVTRMTGSNTDVTPRHELQQELQNKIRKQDIILENAPVGIAYMQNALTVWGNARLAEIFGYAPHEIVGRGTRSFHISEEAYQQTGQLAKDCMSQRGTYADELQMRRRDGALLWIQIWGKAVDASDLSQGEIWILKDITQEKESAHQLKEAMLKAQAANLAKSRFLATMNHELRTPMNGILGMAQLLQKPQLDDQKRLQFAQVVHQSADQLMALLNDILDWTKIESGHLPVEATPVQPEQLLGECMTLFGAKALDKGLHLELKNELTDAQAFYVIDRIRISQVLGHLMSNAIKFTPRSGTVQLQVRWLHHEAQHSLEFAVQDTGIGVSEQQRVHLFEPFVQIDSSSTRQYGGSGLGLALVRKLVELMQGQVGVQSQQGPGARFWFRVPVQEQVGVGLVSAPKETAGKPEPVEPVLTTDDAAVDLSDAPLILVVEDHEINRMVVTSLLARLGVRVEHAHDGRQALQALQGGLKPDLVLMDLQMPVLDGFEATEQIRQWESSTGVARVPIVALTADAYPQTRQKCLDAGMDEYLSKPIDLTRFNSMLRKWVPALA